MAGGGGVGWGSKVVEQYWNGRRGMSGYRELFLANG